MTTEITEENIQKLVAEFQKIADEKGYQLTDNAVRIAKAKLRFFGIDDWRQCPCAQDGQHACLSDCCKEQIETKGVCHCNLFKSNE
jgi:hypothetical protein